MPPRARMLDRGERDLRDIDEVFRALAHRSRRHIVVVIQARGGEMTSGDIADRFSCSWPATTRHLRVLEDAGVVAVERRGREAVYRVDAARLQRVVGGWLRWIEPDSSNQGTT